MSEFKFIYRIIKSSKLLFDFNYFANNRCLYKY